MCGQLGVVRLFMESSYRLQLTIIGSFEVFVQGLKVELTLIREDES